MKLAGTQTVIGDKRFDGSVDVDSRYFRIFNDVHAFYAYYNVNSLTGNRRFSFPNNTGTFALVGDTIPNSALATMAANTVKVNATAGVATPTDLALAASQLLGRGASGNIAPIVLGTNLSMSGATLNAGGGGGTTFSDSVFRIQDNADATKQIAFEASGITTGTTRTFTAPDVDGTLALIGATQTLQNKTLDNTNTATLKDALFTLQDDGDTTKQARFQLSGITTGTTRSYILPDNTGGTILLDNVNQTISGQTTFSNATNNFGTSTGTSFNNLGIGATLNGITKTVSIGTLGVSGSTTNIGIGSAVAGALGTLTINSPTTAFGSTATSFNIPDTVFTLQDNADATKQAKFELSGITTGTTRTYTLPDASVTLAGNAVFTSGANGLAPASGGGTTNFLRADGTFAAPPGAGSGLTQQQVMAIASIRV
jgi:hypothetical protein